MHHMFDTLAASQTLVTAGFSNSQAETIARLLAETSENVRKALVTPADLSASTSKLELAIAETKTLIATSKNDTIRWFLGSQVLLVAMLTALQHFIRP
jgi:hypothetical protein